MDEHVILRDTTLSDIAPDDGHRLEIVATGLGLARGALLDTDATMASPHACGRHSMTTRARHRWHRNPTWRKGETENVLGSHQLATLPAHDPSLRTRRTLERHSSQTRQRPGQAKKAGRLQSDCSNPPEAHGASGGGGCCHLSPLRWWTTPCSNWMAWMAQCQIWQNCWIAMQMK